MRIWTVHPKYLDPSGLTAAWREGLLARKVLQGLTTGYRHHPQLLRFQACRDPLACIERYLAGVFSESRARGYEFDASKVAASAGRHRITETDGQLLYEWGHLKRKLRMRMPARCLELETVERPDPHPLFHIVPGEIREWERGIGQTAGRG